jgi:3-dehydroquinate dehydratase/shikimate dehydrogenase
MSQGPLICAVIGRTRHRMMQLEIHEAAKRGAQLIEVRLDYLAKRPEFKRLLDNKPCPIIATIRRPDDGGRWKGSEDERLMLLRQAVVAGFDYIDLEIDTIDKIRRFGAVKRIVSYHNFRDTPADLEDRYKAMCALDADIVKIAVTAQKTSDNLRVLNLLKNATKPTVVLCMGDLGQCTRILNGRQGSPFTYATFNPERTIAPGLIPFKEMKSIYNYESLKPDTRVFGVIGDPVGHSLSPLIHNGAFKHLGMNAVYLPFRVPRGELTPFLQGFQALPIEGLSVTIPHKELAAKFATQKEPSVEKTSAANTLVFQGGVCKASNTDMRAAIESMKVAISKIEGPDVFPLGKRTVLLLGAGGVARSIAFGLAQEGCQLIIANRTAERALKLAAEVGCRTVDWAARHGVVCDTVVNGTSIGMHPNVDESPLHNSFLRPGMLIFDTIYTPETTLLLREAGERACHTLGGVDMFVRQAGLQFKLFTGQEPPLDVMTKLLRRALSPVNYTKEDTRGESGE